MRRISLFVLATIGLLLPTQSLLFAQSPIAKPNIAKLAAAAVTAANKTVTDANATTGVWALAAAAASVAVATPSATTADAALATATNAVTAANQTVSSANAANTAANMAVLATTPAALATTTAATATATALASAIDAATAANAAFAAASVLVAGPSSATATAFASSIAGATSAATRASTNATAAATACATSATAGQTALTAVLDAGPVASAPPAPEIDVTNSPYRLLVGTNLNFNEKAIDINGLYAKVDVLINNEHGGPYASRWLLKNISLIGNIYLSQSLSGDYSDTLSRRRIDRTLIRSLSNDTVTTVAVSAIEIKTVSRVKSLGFVLQPTIRLFNNQDPPENPLVHPHSSFYAGLHLEVARRAYITNYSYSAPTPLDTLRIRKLPSQPFNYALATSRTAEETVIFYERYYGISFPYRYISRDIDLRFIPSFGLAYLYPGEYIRYMTATFDITERNSGITFGAEIRDYASLRQRPVLSLYLSKAFLLTRLGALLNSRT